MSTTTYIPTADELRARHLAMPAQDRDDWQLLVDFLLKAHREGDRECLETLIPAYLADCPELLARRDN